MKSAPVEMTGFGGTPGWARDRVIGRYARKRGAGAEANTISETGTRRSTCFPKDATDRQQGGGEPQPYLFHGTAAFHAALTVPPIGGPVPPGGQAAGDAQ